MKRVVWVTICAAAFALVWACSQGEIRDISSTDPISKVIGDEYRVVSDATAYGIYADLNNRTVVSNISLITGYRISGPEIAFAKEIEKGKIFKIVGVQKWIGTFSSSIHYRVEFADVQFPAKAPVSIQLDNENTGTGTGLNPKMYERIVSPGRDTGRKE